MTALDIFKQANSSDILNSAGIGAAIGGAGMGAGSLLLDGEKDVKKKLQNALVRGAAGAGLGGLAGAGYAGGKELLGTLFGKGQGGAPAAAGATAAAAPLKKHFEEHPTEALVGNVLQGHKTEAGTVGALLGMLREKGKSSAGDYLYNQAKANVSGPMSIDDLVNSVEKTRAGLRLPADRDTSLPERLSFARRYAGSHGESAGAVDAIIKNYIARDAGGRFGPLRFTVDGKLDPYSNSVITKLLERLDPKLRAELQNPNNMGVLTDRLRSVAGQVNNPISSRFARYGGAGAAGGIAGYALGAGADLGFKQWLNNKYPAEQLKLWNEAAKAK